MTPRTLILATVALLGCQAEPTEHARTLDHQAPPPAPPEMALYVTPMVAGGMITLRVEGAPMGTEVTFAWGLDGLGDGFCPPDFDGRCMGLRGQVTPIASTRYAQPDGSAELTWIIPPNLEGRYLGFQAAVSEPDPKFSNPVASRVAPAGTPVQPLVDGDGDGWRFIDGDCDDTLAAVNPGADDVAGDGFDTNCDRADGIDRDRDGVGSMASGGADCDDGAFLVRPGAPDSCDGIDNDCDGTIDADADGVTCGRPETFATTSADHADLLFVVHDGPGMAMAQRALGDMGSALFGTLRRYDIDAQVGVISTAASDPNDSGQLQGLGDARFVPTVYSTDDGLNATWFERVTDLGTAGGSGEGLRAASLAFAGINAQANALFRRDDADLHVVFVSNIDDQSGGVPSASTFLQGFDMLVTPPATFTAHGLIAPPGGCAGATEGTTWFDVIDQTGGAVRSICDGPYDGFVRDLAAAMTDDATTTDTFTLSRPADPDSILVTATPPGPGSVVVRDWTFDAANNSVTVTRPLAPFAHVTITYDVM